MKKFLTVLTVLAFGFGIGVAQVIKVDKSGHRNAYTYGNDVAAEAFFNVTTSGAEVGDVLYGKYVGSGGGGSLFVWATEVARNAADTTTSLAGANGTACAAPTGTSPCTLTLTPRNLSGLTVALQYQKPGLDFDFNIDFVRTDVGRSVVTAAITASAAAVVDSLTDTATFFVYLRGLAVDDFSNAFASRSGNIVTICIPTLSGTSDSLGAEITGVTAPFRPRATRVVTINSGIVVGADNYGGVLDIKTAGNIGLLFKTTTSNNPTSTWPITGVKRFNSQCVSYPR